MDWIMEPISAFRTLDRLAADSCTGQGTQLNQCDCTGGLVVCRCTGGLEVQKAISG